MDESCRDSAHLELIQRLRQELPERESPYHKSTSPAPVNRWFEEHFKRSGRIGLWCTIVFAFPHAYVLLELKLRPELCPPLRENPDFVQALGLVERIYQLVRSDSPCRDELAQLNAISRFRLEELDFAKDERDELITPEELTIGLVLHRIPTPQHLVYEEMLELVEKLKTNGAEDGLHVAFWTKCLSECTGDANFSQLLQGGAELYFRDGISRWMTPKEILDTALVAGGKLHLQDTELPGIDWSQRVAADVNQVSADQRTPPSVPRKRPPKPENCDLFLTLSTDDSLVAHASQARLGDSKWFLHYCGGLQQDDTYVLHCLVADNEDHGRPNLTDATCEYTIALPATIKPVRFRVGAPTGGQSFVCLVAFAELEGDNLDDLRTAPLVAPEECTPSWRWNKDLPF